MANEESSTVSRAIAVLEQLANNPGGVSISELATRVGTQRAPLYRILKSLENARFVRRDENRLYTLSFGLVTLAAAAAEPLDAIVKPLLTELAEQTQCSAMLLLRNNDDNIVTALCLTPSAPGMHITTVPGFVHPRARVASRIAIESSRPPQEKDPADVVQARAQGFATSGSPSSGARFGIAAPVDLSGLGEEGCVLLLSLQEVEEAEIVKHLLKTTSALTTAISK